VNHSAGIVPFNYGDLITITEGPTFWFQDKNTGLIRGVKLVPSGETWKLGIGDNEIHIKRAGADATSGRPGARTPIPGSIPPISANAAAAPPSKTS
jgi:hypothetical protein